MHKVKTGNLIDYSLSIISSYLYIPNWTFQSDKHKIKSEFDAAVLSNYKFNPTTTGILKSDKKDVSIAEKWKSIIDLVFKNSF